MLQLLVQGYKNMSQLVQIKDFYFLALKDDADITDKDKKSFLLMDLKDDFWSPKIIDVPTSMALLEEFDACPYAESYFVNDTDKETPETTIQNDYVYVGPSYSVKSEKIPLLLKKAGLKIKRNQLIAYLAPDNDPEHPYKLVKRDGAPFETEDATNNFANEMNIEIYDDVLALRKEEYNTYLRVKEGLANGKYSEFSKRDISLWALTDTFINRQEKQDVVFHEIRHAQNCLILYDYLFDNPDCKLSCADIFKQNQDNELSAKIAEAIQAINTYNTSKNKNDLSVFESSCLLQKLLYDKSVEERKRLLSNIPSIIREICMYWYRNFFAAYMPQFIENLEIELKKIPLNHLVQESDGTAYKEIRKRMFTYRVYNANTGKYENMDLSGYVFEAWVDESMLADIQKIYQNTVISRQEGLKRRQDRVQNDLLDEAAEKYKDCVLNTEYRKTLADLQRKGMDYMAALNFVPDSADKQNIEIKSPQEVVQPDIIVPKQEELTPEKKESLFKKALHKIEQKISSRLYRNKDDDGIVL